MRIIVLKALIVIGISILSYIATGIVFHETKYYYYDRNAPKREISEDLYNRFFDSDEYDNVDLEYEFNHSYAFLTLVGVLSVGLIIIAFKELKQSEEKKNFNEETEKTRSNSKPIVGRKEFLTALEKQGTKVLEASPKPLKNRVIFLKKSKDD